MISLKIICGYTFSNVKETLIYSEVLFVVEYTGRRYRFETFMSAGKKSEVEKPLASELPETDAKLWPDVYGFGRAATAKPVATATLVGNQGTVIEVVFYSLNLGDGSGSGVGRDNAGNWYRVYVGELER